MDDDELARVRLIRDFLWLLWDMAEFRGHNT